MSCIQKWPFQFKMFIFWPMTIYLFYMHSFLITINVFALILYKNKTKPTVVIFQEQKLC